MAKTPETTAPANEMTGTAPGAVESAPTTETKAKRTRAPSEPKPIFAVIQVLDSEGNPIQVTKGQVRLVSFEKSAEKVLEVIDGGSVPGALYLRGMLPAGR